MSKFFINRPIFACAIAILMIVAGLATVFTLPIAQFPTITPPTVQVTAFYPGASASTISQTVAVPIEQQVNGVEGMLYMNSVSSSSGVYTLTVTFEVGTDIDMATVLVQNRVSVAMSSLPQDVTRLGVTTKKVATDIILMATLKSDNPEQGGLFLSNYTKLNMVDQLSRLPGVGSVSLFGADDYSMRIWLDPNTLQARGLTPMDVYNAIKEQNVQISAGKVGEEPSTKTQAFQYTLDVKGRLVTEQEFGNMIIRNEGNGQFLRLKDIAQLELGSKSYNINTLQDGKPMAAIAIYQLPGANALSVAELAREALEKMSQSFPKGVTYDIPLDTTRFVEVSIEEVYKTLFEAMILVLIVILLFLQNWRAVLIPTITIPVSLIATFAVMGVMGFSINTLTLFGMILAIGIVVDDAILVVENTYRFLETGKYSPKEATIRAMEEVSGPIVGIVLVLLAVFVPTAFIGGITGQLYKQFALTIAVSTFFSGVNALTLSPALCAILLKPEEHDRKKNFIYTYFDKTLAATTNIYVRIVANFLRKRVMTMTIFLSLAALAFFGFMKWPTTFIPNEDQGYFIASVQLPEGASMERTRAVTNKVLAVIDSLPGVSTYVAINGNSLMDGAQASNASTIFVPLKDWSERTDPSLSVEQLVKRFNTECSQIEEAVIFGFSPPAISGLGNSGGLEFVLQDKNNLGTIELQKALTELSDKAAADPDFIYTNATFKANVPQLFIDIDRDKVKMQDLSLNDVFSTLSFYLGGAYANDFVKFGRVYQVKLQAGTEQRSTVEDIMKLTVRNSQGKMVPFSAFSTIENRFGTELISRYNMFTSATMTAIPTPGVSSGAAIGKMEKIADDLLGANFSYEWTSMAYQEKASASSTMVIYVLAIIIVFLVLASQYESWTSPLAVLMSIPIALLGVVVGCIAMKMPISVYTQIGIVLLIALAAKNAILIVEFAREFRQKGFDIDHSCLEAGKVRFRPILMTSFAFILGVAPLVMATGAGAASRVSLGIAVFAGMTFTAFIGTLFIPTCFQYWERIQVRYFDKKPHNSTPEQEIPTTAEIAENIEESDKQ